MADMHRQEIGELQRHAVCEISDLDLRAKDIFCIFAA